MERVWEFTQTPQLHRRWDLRFSEIDYLPTPAPGEPQQFRYATRMGFGLCIHGRGETAGTLDGADGSRTSALRFWSDDPKSLIRIGSGYWKYAPRGDTVTFWTCYDYDTRFGLIGRVFDRSIFRPLMGWATAWSFDRLRLWIERGIDPRTALIDAAVYFVARLMVALVWLYQGVVPKLIFRHADELAMLRACGVPPSWEKSACTLIGAAEALLGLYLLVRWRARWPLWFTTAAMPAATVAVAFTLPRFLTAPFNATTLNAAMFALSLIALLNQTRVPSAVNCLRRPPRGEE